MRFILGSLTKINLINYNYNIFRQKSQQFRGNKCMGQTASNLIKLKLRLQTESQSTST